MRANRIPHCGKISLHAGLAYQALRPLDKRERHSDQESAAMCIAGRVIACGVRDSIDRRRADRLRRIHGFQD